ncbi:MAG: NAD-dependent epimerase/dehydratase family protein [Flavipsychrobacter sp.]|nr:NAD-dependent epimerase/dehydratase family protein [Flavipsychrobacter sp.]
MVLVTGASGFIGQHLVRLLSSRGANVRALYHRNAPGQELKELPNVDWYKYDLLDVYDVAEAMYNVTEVYHCAARVSFDPAHREEMMHFNVESTANLVNQALEQGIRKMVYLSSIAALGRATESGLEITEDVEWEESKHNSAYAQSKYLAEMEVWRGIGEGLNAAIINPAPVLGEGNWEEGSARLMTVVYGEFPFYTEGVTAWVDVRDVVAAAYTLMQSEVCGERFILSVGNHAYKEVFTMMADALGKKPPHIRASPFMSGLVWRFNALKNALTGRPVTITRETAATAQRKNYYDNTKFLRFFPGFSYTPLPETVRRMADAFLKEHPKKR